MTTLSIIGLFALAPIARAASTTSYGSVSISGGIATSDPILGGCSARSSSFGTTVSVRTQAINGMTLAVTGTSEVPSGAIDLAHTATFNVEVQIASGTGSGGIWLAGLAGPNDIGSGTLSLSAGANSGSVNATLVPYGGGTISKKIQLKASWNCNGASASTGQTTPTNTSGNAASTLLSRVPSSLFGCTSNPNRDLGGANVVFRYNATAEVDCEVEGVAGVNGVIYLLYPTTKAMNAAFDKVFVGKAARPRAGLGCQAKNFVTAVCGYHVGNSKSTAGSYVRFFYELSGDPIRTPAIAWTSNRYRVIAYATASTSNGTQAVESYWTSGKPNPV